MHIQGQSGENDYRISVADISIVEKIIIIQGKI